MKKSYNSIAVRISAFVMVAFFAVMFVVLQLQKNDLAGKVADLENKIAEVNEIIYQLEADIARPFDDEYVSEIAHEELGLCYPQEIIFVSGDSK